METRRLAYFIGIADAGSIGRAAATLGLSQPGLSQQLAILENEVGVRLLHRSNDGVRLTTAGQAFYARAQAIVRQVSSLRRDLQAAEREISGPVALGLTPSQALSAGLAVLERVLAEQPRISLRIVEQDSALLLQMLQNGLLDLAIAPVAHAAEGIEFEPLIQEAVFLVQAASSPPPPSDIEDLAALSWIVTPAPHAIRRRIAAMFAGSGREPCIVAEINSLPLLLTAVARGHGATLLPGAAVERSGIAGLKLWSLPQSSQPNAVCLCARRNGFLTPASLAVADIVRDWALDASKPG